jgi:hypothetical protein
MFSIFIMIFPFFLRSKKKVASQMTTSFVMLRIVEYLTDFILFMVGVILNVLLSRARTRQYSTIFHFLPNLSQIIFWALLKTSFFVIPIYFFFVFVFFFIKLFIL